MAKKSKTHVVFVADESGSMHHLQKTSIDSFNEYVDDLKSGVEGKVLLTLCKFNTYVETVYANMPIADVPPLTTETYRPGGLTALYDAIATGVRQTDEVMKKKDRAICIIMTDGGETSSREMTKETITKLIKKYEDKGNWTFVYLGADQNAWAAAGAIGIAQGNAASYSNTEHSHSNTMRALYDVTATRHTHALASTHTAFADAGVKVNDDGKLDEGEPKDSTDPKSELLWTP